MTGLQPRTVLVTGAASGIGKAAAALCETRGWSVIRSDLHEGDIIADLASPWGRETLVADAERLTGGRLDAVIACAGILAASPVTIAVNYFGMVHTLAGLRPLLEKGSQPRAAAISSYGAIAEFLDPEIEEACARGNEAGALSASQGKSWPNLYGTSKRLIMRWIRQQAISDLWAGRGILLNAIGPGIVQTPMTAAIDSLEDGQAVRDGSGFEIPLGRRSTPEEQGEVLFWLASEMNSYITGQLLLTDGGAEAAARPRLY